MFMQIMKNLYNRVNQGGGSHFNQGSNSNTFTAPYKQFGTQNYLSGFMNQFSPTESNF